MPARPDEAGQPPTPQSTRPPDIVADPPRDSPEEKPGWLERFRKAQHDGPRIKLVLDHEDKHKESIAAATGAAMAHVLSRPDSIRQRAQHAATIASAFAAALVIAAVAQLSGGDESWRDETKYLVFSAMFLWAVTAAMFVYAVAFVAGDRTKEYDLQNLVEAYETYADRVRLRMRWAAAVSAVALIVTVVAVVAETAELMSSTDRSMRLVLTASGASDVAAICWPDSPALEYVDAKMPENELTGRSVRIEDPIGHFGTEKKGKACESGTVLRLPRSAVRAAVELK
jgi:hypothetical protein